MNDEQLRRALDEATRPDDHRLRALLRALRNELSQAPSEEVSSRHLAAIMHAVRTTRPAPVSLTWRQRVAGVVARVMAATTVKVAIGAGAAAAATGGLAAGGVLGEPVREIAYVVADSVGVPLPEVERLDRDAVLARPLAEPVEVDEAPGRTAATSNPPAEPREAVAPRNVSSTPLVEAVPAEPEPTAEATTQDAPQTETPSPTPSPTSEPSPSDGSAGSADTAACEVPSEEEGSGGTEDPATASPHPDPSPSPDGEAEPTPSPQPSPTEECSGSDETPEPTETAEDETDGTGSEPTRESVRARHPGRAPGR